MKSVKTAASGLRVTALCKMVVAALALGSGSAGAVTFMQAYEAALQNDPNYRMGYYENEFGKENRVLGRVGLLPSLSANYSASRNRVDLEGIDSLGRPTLTHPQYISRSAVVQLRQPLLNLEGIARYRQGVVQTEAAEAQFAARGAEVILRVAGAYLDALLANDSLVLAQAQRDAYAEQAKVNTRLMEKGEGTKTDMLETAARLDQAEAQVIEARDTLATSLSTLADIIGMEPGTLQPLAPGFRFAPLSPSGYEAWKALAIANNADLRAARLAAEAARLEIQKAKAGHAPRVDLIATYAKNDAETVNTFTQNSTNRSIGVQVNLPLYSGGQVNSLTRQSVAAFQRALAEVEARSDKVTIELRRAHSLVQSSVARIAALDKAVASAELLTKATVQSIKGGVRINLDLLSAEQQLTGVKRDLAQARYNYLMALLRLRAAAGTLAPGDVQEVATYFR